MASPPAIPLREVSEAGEGAVKAAPCFDGLGFLFLIRPLSSFRVRLGRQLRLHSPQELHRERRLHKSQNQIQVRGQRSAVDPFGTDVCHVNRLEVSCGGFMSHASTFLSESCLRSNPQQ